MSAQSRSILRYSISFLLAFGFLYLAFRGVKLSELWESLKGANYWWVALLIPLNILMNWVRAERWAHLLAPIKSPISKRSLFSGVMIGYAINNVLPRVGEIVRPYIIGNREGISRSSVFGTIVVERILDFMSFYFIVCIVLFLYPHSLDPFVNQPDTVRPLFLLGSIAGLIFFVLLFFKAEALFRFLAKVFRFLPDKQKEKIEKILDKFYTGFAVAKLRDKFGVILFQSFLIWGLNALIMFVPFFAFAPLVKSGMDFGASVVLLVISSIAWILPAPGAMGTYHSFLKVAMMKLYGIDETTSLSYAIVTHEVGYLVVMVIGAYYYFRDHLQISDLTSASSKEE
ncbi:MAG: lysylphosphatidylglycerol synthase transmembrane domain-containing protein [Ignavibacteriales bacterium]|nr:lysylphosphatidylglycerol synthase transmembrane domain-containing protein [Ignavibacteriales bacterium]